jgi:polysaccharide export outer membrane protein
MQLNVKLWCTVPPSSGVSVVQAKAKAIQILLGLSLLSGISGGCALLPSDGPKDWDIRGQNPPPALSYAVVKVTPNVNKILGKAAPRLAQFAERRRPANIRFGVGDIVSVTIFEASTGGLFIPADAGVRPGNFVTIPNQAVDANGNISIPYAGSILARGRTPVEVQNAIVDALKNRAIEPQVIVSLTTQQTSLVTVIAEGRAQRVPASHEGERILDTIARAGGPGGAGSDMWVMLERRGRRALAPFGALIYESNNNVYTHPNDTIYLYREPQTFVSFGALGQQKQVPFEAWRISLAEALAKSGGLIDQRSDPSSVFLYRGETRDVAEAMGVDCSPFEGPIIPIIYNLDLRDPSGYFLATTFEMRNKDVVYVTNSLSVEHNKFFTYVSNASQAVQGPVDTVTSIYGLRNIIRGTGPVPGLTTTTTTPAAPPP